MYILAFDEYGTFENVTDEQTKYIAGALYEGTEYDIEVERKRILAYLQDACAAVSADFPNDLHQNRQNNNWKQVGEVEKNLKHTIAEFIRQGTVHGRVLCDDLGNEFPARKGCYDIFAMVKSNAGKPELLKYGTDPIVNDMVASNLYVHMAEDLLGTLLFHNPMVGELKNVRLELASRSLPASVLSTAKRDEYREIGIEDAGDGYQILYRAANMDTYRTVLQREMQRLGKVDQDIFLEVLPINYNHAAPGMAFLYMADFICGFLHTEPKVSDSARINYAYKKAKEITGREPYVFGYDAVDVRFAKAWQHQETGLFFEALSEVYEACRGEDAFAAFYREHWMPRIEEGILKQNDVYSLRAAVRKLESATFATEIDQDRLVYVFSALERCCVSANAHRPDARMLYKLYNSGIAACNHIGDAANAAACFSKCLLHSDGAFVDEFIRTRNRMAVAYCDAFEFGKAAEITEDTIVHAELLRENRNMIFGKEEGSDLLHGITHSQYGQILSYMRDDEAEEHFKIALDEMGEGTPNFYITLSYLLHYYIDAGDKEKYVKYAASYFGGEKTLAGQYAYLCSSGGVLNAKYALNVYVKAMWVFFRDAVPETVKGAFGDIRADFEKRGLSGMLGGDPWEVIFKYLLLFARADGNTASEKMYKKLLEAPVGRHEGTTVEFVRKFGLIQYYEACGNRALMIQRTRELYQAMVEYGYLAEEPGADGDRIMERLRERFTYMYC